MARGSTPPGVMLGGVALQGITMRAYVFTGKAKQWGGRGSGWVGLVRCVYGRIRYKSRSYMTAAAADKDARQWCRDNYVDMIREGDRV